MRALFRKLLTRWNRLPSAIRVLSVLCAIALPVWAHFDDTAWDMKVYDQALVSLDKGHDPYLDATNIQKDHHRLIAESGAATADTNPPYSYVYAPITLPLLKTLGRLPRSLLIVLYLMVYLAGALAAVAACCTFAEPSERPGVWALACVAVFFPGLLSNGVILSGNIAYILYGAIFAAALLGWRRGHWLPFFAAILFATCVKAPLLSLVVIAPLSDWKQLRATAVTTSVAIALYMAQPMFAPALFRHYLEAVELQFSFNHDFGCSPAGLFSNILYHRGIPYAPGCYFIYLAYALPVFAGLLYASRQYHRGRITLRQLGPVMLVGVLLLNPRIMEYDAAAITLPMALIAWRMARYAGTRNAVYTAQAVLFLVLNALSIYSWLLRKTIDGPLILLTYFGGLWLLQRDAATFRINSRSVRDSHNLAAV